MPNWCFTQYAIQGDSRELKSLHKTMKSLEKMKEPLVPNGFGKKWLGCLVHALGGDEKVIWCRGDFSEVKLDKDERGLPTLSFQTETAWGPATEVEDFLREKFPSLCIWFLTEESGMGLYQTNDEKHLFFKDCIRLDHEDETVYLSEEETLSTLSEILGQKFNDLKEAFNAVDKHNKTVAEDDNNNWIGILVPQLAV